MKRIFTVICAFAMVSCATTSNNFKPTEIDTSKDNVIVGSFSFTLDGEEQTDKCKVIFNDDDRTFVELDKTGNVFARATKGKVHLHRVLCHTGVFGKLVSFDFDKKDVYFKSIEGQINYFGHVDIHWSSESRSPLWFLLGAGVAGAMGEATKRIYLKVSDKSEITLKEYESVINKPMKNYSKNIINIPGEYLIPKVSK